MYGNNLFEFGTQLPQFWLSFQGWASLFKDTQLPYGLWDYAQLLFGWLFSGQHTAAVSTYGVHLFIVFVLILEFFAASLLLPVGLAFLLVLVAGVATQSVVLIYCCILLIPRLINRPVVWIAVWTVLSAFMPFARVPAGHNMRVRQHTRFLMAGGDALPPKSQDVLEDGRVFGCSGFCDGRMAIWTIFLGTVAVLHRGLADQCRLYSQQLEYQYCSPFRGSIGKRDVNHAALSLVAILKSSGAAIGNRNSYVAFSCVPSLSFLLSAV